MRYVAGQGDANDIKTWSGIPYHFLEAGKRAGMLDHGLRTRYAPPGVKLRRTLWNLRQVLKRTDPGGYQFTDEYQHSSWGHELQRADGDVIVNTFQIYPSAVVENRGVRKWYFLDQTLTQLKTGNPGTVGRRAWPWILQQERKGYLAAEGVILHSHWAAESVIRDYGVSPARVHVAVPGANILAEQYEAWEKRHQRTKATGGLRLLFLGRDWQRKGLDRLLLGFDAARRKGLRAELLVAGPRPQELPRQLRSIEGVQWLGLVNKAADYAGFLDLVSSCHLGMTLSHWEPGGIATREFHALGVPTLVSNVCGAAEHQLAEAGLLLPAHAVAHDVAATLLQLPERLETLRGAAWELRRQATYQGTFEAFRKFWPHDTAKETRDAR
jgi:glycosyltransferase involved in cell wall biosynthesis